MRPLYRTGTAAVAALALALATLPALVRAGVCHWRLARQCCTSILSAPILLGDDSRPAIQARYDRFNASLVGKNVAAIAGFCTADCKFQTRPDGPTLSLDQFRQATTAQFKALTIRRAKTTIDSAQPEDDATRVKATWTADLLSTGKDKKKHRVHSVQKLEDAWSKTPKGWMLRSSKVLAVQTTIDGKPMKQ